MKAITMPNGASVTDTANSSTPLCPLPMAGHYNEIDAARVCERPEARRTADRQLLGTPGDDRLCGEPSVGRIEGTATRRGVQQ